jgi:hypothetical protein
MRKLLMSPLYIIGGFAFAIFIGCLLAAILLRGYLLEKETSQSATSEVV